MQLQFSHPSISDSEFVERIEQKKASFYRVAFGYTRNEDDALEVVQEAVCKAYTAKWRLRDPERFYPWFYRILTNTAPLSFLRRRPPQGAVQEAWDALPAEDGEERWADSLWLREELGRLDDRSRTVILLKFYEDMTFREIAQVLRKPESTVKSDYSIEGKDDTDMIQTSEGNLPQGLDAAIRTGLERGRRTVARRARVRRGAVRSALCLALVLGLFAGGVNASPAFAAAMEELPILGRLVQVFRVNAPSVDGGQTAAGSRAALTMEREGDTEWLTLRYEQSSAGRYHAEFASFPKTVTLTLPGTERVEILSELSRAQDTSQYIKSVYTAEGWVDRAAVVQLELESDADVQLREYQEPGSIVIRLTPAENRLDTIYSLRTLSADSPEALRSMAAPEEGARLLRDNAGRLFVELGQYDTREKAERAAGDRGAAGLIVERRTGNNVPVCYETEEAYQSAVLLDGYNELLQTTVEVEPILAFLEEHLAGASAEVQDTMLRGLTGFLDGNEAGLDWERIAACYAMAGQTLPEKFQ